MSEDSDSHRFIMDELRSIRDEVSSLRDTAVETNSRLPRVEEDVTRLVKTVHLGNGSPPLTQQLASISESIADLEEKFNDSLRGREDMMEAMRNLSTRLDNTVTTVALSEAEASKQKWITYGKIAAGLSLVVPGIVAFVSSVL